MQWLRNLSIRHKLTLIIMATSTLVLSLVAAAFVYYQVIHFRRHLADRMLSQAGIIAASSRLPVYFNDLQTAQETLSALENEPTIVLGMIFRAGKPIAYYLRAGEDMAWQSVTGKKIGEELPALLASGEKSTIYRAGYLDVVVPIHHDGKKIGGVYLRSDLRALHTQVLDFILATLGILGAAFLVASFLSVKLQRFISRPLIHLVQTMEAVAQTNDFSLRGKAETEDEIGVLVERFNTMLAQLQSRDQALSAYRDALEDTGARAYRRIAGRQLSTPPDGATVGAGTRCGAGGERGQIPFPRQYEP